MNECDAFIISTMQFMYNIFEGSIKFKRKMEAGGVCPIRA